MLCREPWHGYWVQGAVFDFITPTASAVYTISGLFIVTSECVEVGAIEEGNEGQEVFML